MNIKVSVILPSLNVADYIVECLNSVINQSLCELEIICVDAGSTDGTREKLENYVKQDSRIKLIDSKIKSYGTQVNMGIRNAKGKYIAILDTDDFVMDNMYEKLFLLAEENELDYVMADYKSFYDDSDKGRVYTEIEVFQNMPEIYGKVLSMHDHAHIYNGGDVNLWRGVYSADFLKRNHITLNETPGAAYQDICFIHRVRMNAQRSMYVNVYGYCYRRDRAESSINSVKGLQYAWYEYKYLLEKEDIPEEYLGRVYYMMLMTLLGESRNFLVRSGFVWENENANCLEWFQKTLKMAIDRNLLSASMCSPGSWRRLRVLLRSKEEYAKRLKLIYENHKQIEDIARTASVIVICGAGKRGEVLMEHIKKVEYCMNSRRLLYVDNDSRLWDTWLNGTKILSVDDCAEGYREAVYIISSKFYQLQIREQLLSKGIHSRQIYEYVPTFD